MVPRHAVRHARNNPRLGLKYPRKAIIPFGVPRREVHALQMRSYLRAAQVAASTLLGAYSSASDNGVRTAVRQTGAAWVISQPAAALLTWLRHTALPASTTPSPVVAVAVLGVLVAWRASFASVRCIQIPSRELEGQSASALNSQQGRMGLGCWGWVSPPMTHTHYFT